jgi:hypothetical protein
MTMQSPSPSIEPAPGVGASSELKRSVSQATERISEIITAAEQVALDIRTDAENQARDYVAHQQREIDRLVSERGQSLDRMTETLAESAERFRRQAEQMLRSLDEIIEEARSAMAEDRSALSEPAELPELELAPAPVAQPEFSPEPGFALSRPAVEEEVEDEIAAEVEDEIVEEIAAEVEEEIEDEIVEEIAAEVEEEIAEEAAAEDGAVEAESEEPPVRLSAYQGTTTEEPDAERADDSAEAMLRATQMAIAGNTREEITRVLESDFAGVDAKSVIDEILGG